MCHAAFGGALVSIVWFEAIHVTCAVSHVFLLDSGLESIARILWCRQASATHSHLVRGRLPSFFSMVGL